MLEQTLGEVIFNANGYRPIYIYNYNEIDWTHNNSKHSAIVNSLMYPEIYLYLPRFAMNTDMVVNSVVCRDDNSDTAMVSISTFLVLPTELELAYEYHITFKDSVADMVTVTLGGVPVKEITKELLEPAWNLLDLVDGVVDLMHTNGIKRERNGNVDELIVDPDAIALGSAVATRFLKDGKLDMSVIKTEMI